MKTVRISAKAIIIRDGKLLAIKNVSGGESWYILPGGGQNHGETLEEALKRECMEEASVSVEVGDVVFVRDYISRNHEFAREDNDAHQVEIMFRCTVDASATPKTGVVADQWQTGVEWLPLERLSQYSMYPSQLTALLTNGIQENAGIYLGDVN